MADKRHVIHLFKEETPEGPNDKKAAREVVMHFGKEMVYKSLYYDTMPTLCGIDGGYLYVFTAAQINQIPLVPERERMCKRCMRSPDAALRFLSAI